MNTASMRDIFFDFVYKIAKKDRDVIVMTADMGAPSLDKFKKDFSAQFVNVGIAEENIVTVATGLAMSGKKVFIYAIMPFITARCYEMIKVNLSLMNIPVTIVGVGAGFSYDDSGPTHHSTEDIAIMRALPNMTILNPSDIVMAGKFAEMSCEILGPSYVRLDREVLPVIYKKDSDFSHGLTNLKRGKDLYIISTGNMTHKALEISDKLSHSSVDAGVIDLYRLKPINAELLLEEIRGVKKIVTLEEHLISGGIGSAIAEVLTDNNKALLLKRLAIPDRYYYAYGGRKNIQTLCRLDIDNVTTQILDYIK